MVGFERGTTYRGNGMGVPSALESREKVWPQLVLRVRQERKADINEAHGPLRGRITLRMIRRRGGRSGTKRREELGHDAPNQLLRVIRTPTQRDTIHMNNTTQNESAQRRGITPCAREEDEAVGREVHCNAYLVVPISSRMNTLQIEAPLRTRGAQRVRAKHPMR